MGSADVEAVAGPVLEAEATLRVELTGTPAKAVTRVERQAATASAPSLVRRAAAHFIVAAAFELASTAQARPFSLLFSLPLYRSGPLPLSLSLSASRSGVTGDAVTQERPRRNERMSGTSERARRAAVRVEGTRGGRTPTPGPRKTGGGLDSPAR